MASGSIGLSGLPGEVLLHIVNFLDYPDLVRLQLVSRTFLRIGRDNAFWKAACFHDSTFHALFHRFWRRKPQGGPHQGNIAHQDDAFYANASTAAMSSNALGQAALLLSLSGVDETPLLPRQRDTLNSEENATVESREREKVRIMANWDPAYPTERVSWYDEYIHRHGQITVNWMQLARKEERHGRQQYPLEARGVAIYRPDNPHQHGDVAESIFAVSPLDDGGVCMWDISGSKGRKGAIVARSKPGILFLDDPQTAVDLSSTRADSGVVECVSVDSQRHRAFFAVQNHLIEVDLQTLSVVSCESFPWTISALSMAHPTVPLTVGTNLGIHLHDYRLQTPRRAELPDMLDGYGQDFVQGTGQQRTNYLYERGLRTLFDAEPLPPYAPLAQPGPLSILHLQRAGSETELSDDIYVAGRFSSILHYDRRKFPTIAGSIYSGARLSSMTSLPYPSSTVDLELRTRADMSIEQVHASKTMPNRRTLIACGEYNTKGSLEIYGLVPPSSPYIGVPGGSQNSVLKNRQSSSQSKLLSVANHGTRIAVSDGSGDVKWFERDGFTEVRRERLGHSETHSTPSLFATMPGSDEIARKLLAVRSNGQETAKANDNDLLFWTGEKLGLLGFTTKPGLKPEDFEPHDPSAEDAETAEAERNHTENMRRALERQAADVRFVANFGLGSGTMG